MLHVRAHRDYTYVLLMSIQRLVVIHYRDTDMKVGVARLKIAFIKG